MSIDNPAIILFERHFGLSLETVLSCCTVDQKRNIELRLDDFSSRIMSLVEEPERHGALDVGDYLRHMKPDVERAMFQMEYIRIHREGIAK